MILSSLPVSLVMSIVLLVLGCLLELFLALDVRFLLPG